MTWGEKFYVHTHEHSAPEYRDKPTIFAIDAEDVKSSRERGVDDPHVYLHSYQAGFPWDETAEETGFYLSDLVALGKLAESILDGTATPEDNPNPGYL